MEQIIIWLKTTILGIILLGACGSILALVIIKIFVKLLQLLKKLYNTVLILIIFVIMSCGFYSMAGSIPPHIKSIAIPLVNNQTAEFGIAENITDNIIEVLDEEEDVIENKLGEINEATDPEKDILNVDTDEETIPQAQDDDDDIDGSDDEDEDDDFFEDPMDNAMNDQSDP